MRRDAYGDPDGGRGGGALLALASCLFFLSGFSALLYQTVWQRLLGFFSGVDVHSVTVIVAAFMGGLGLGSLAGGALADRLGNRGRLAVFFLAELVIAGFALGSAHLFYDVLYVRFHHLSASPAALVGVLFGALLVPTFCMGVTLPILAKSFTLRLDAAPVTIGVLYGVNTLGAAAGAFVTGWVLLRRFDFHGVLQIGAAVNGVAALGALVVLGVARPREEEGARAMGGSGALPVTAGAGGGAAGTFSVGTWLGIYALSGFLALGLEIVWFRLLGTLQKSTAFTFGNLLGIYLTGLALGVFAGLALAARSRRPGRWFLVLQIGVLVYVAGSLTWLLRALPGAPAGTALAAVWTHLGGYEPVDIAAVLGKDGGGAAGWALFVSLYFGLPALLLGPPTFLMGASFPLLQRAVQTDAGRLGRRVGALQTMNILGSMAGAIGVGTVGLDWLGTAGTLRALVALGIGVFGGLLLWRRGGRRVVGPAFGALALGALVWALPDARTLWARLHGMKTAGRLIHAEDGSGLAVLKARGTDEATGFREGADVFSNGIGQSWLPYGDVHSLLGAVPVILHPNPRNVAVIGLASGDTAYALGGRRETESVTCIEIVRPQLTVLKELNDRMDYGALHGLLSDPRTRLRFTDGRAYLRRTERRFDVIEADALRPGSAYSGNLYSKEYFELLRSKLRPGGLAVSWSPTERVRQTFVNVFPHGIWLDGIVLGSNEPIVVDRASIEARLRDPFTAAHYARAGVPVEQFFVNLLAGRYQTYTPETDRASLRAWNRDLAPRDEYLAPFP